MAIEIAKREMSKLMNCDVSDFDKKENVIIEGNSKNSIRMVSFGRNTVCNVDKSTYIWAMEFYHKIPSYRCFDLVQLDTLNSQLKQYGTRISSVGEYFIPNMKNIKRYKTDYQSVILKDKEIRGLHKFKDFPMALSYGNPEADVLAIVAYSGDVIMGVAACSNDFDSMYQIGVDVIPQFRNQGVAKHLVAELTYEVLKLGKLPFVGTSIGNIASKKLAQECGYVHAWIEMYSDTIEATNKYLDQKFQL